MNPVTMLAITVVSRWFTNTPKADVAREATEPGAAPAVLSEIQYEEQPQFPYPQE